MGEFIGVHTLRDEYHLALRRGLEKMQATNEVKLQVRWMHNHEPSVYIALGVIANDYGYNALQQAVRIMMCINNSLLPNEDTNIFR